MKTLLIISIILGTTFASIGQDRPYKLADLGWMAGCWANSSMSSEHRMTPDGGMMIGMSRTKSDEKRANLEYFRIEQRGLDLIFIGRSRKTDHKAEFKAIKLIDNEVVFENPAKFFPQRVIYRLTPAGRLAGRIEGNLNGKQKGINFPMHRAACDK